ncbi:transcriptional regulator [Niallia circulans]|jgi:putative transcriptional regulator|uniref:DNA-binding protein n=1 Tax=Niallia circulans TaxID=1397 RepID=A0A0J1IRH0_NIACI|nr:helix-turn-helix transcriptional regulator [Niallia circulans]KLV28553.1 DNA-binding protein [Niallia circulans]MDR4315307.1 helix-turn-helix transcriptional regulator [Niallia circulans]MED3841486.1 helix-turn-helix transcriptional regulator [Niallia circulans]MED4245672.1 helix-turn-helix transcriptional regulator [Niallia circulans]MED4248194.1 helix-turn-helix transcriptional regulator [Niallia circulans]
MKNRIRELRKSSKLSQEELAKLCNVTRQTINAIENDKYDPTLQLAFSLASALATTVDELFIYDTVSK